MDTSRSYREHGGSDSHARNQPWWRRWWSAIAGAWDRALRAMDPGPLVPESIETIGLAGPDPGPMPETVLTTTPPPAQPYIFPERTDLAADRESRHRWRVAAVATLWMTSSPEQILAIIQGGEGLFVRRAAEQYASHQFKRSDLQWIYRALRDKWRSTNRIAREMQKAKPS